MTRAGTTNTKTGRPLKLNAIIDRDDHGRPITAGDKVIALIRSVWIPWEDAAASTGVAARTIRDWRSNGAIARERIANWSDGDKPVTQNERDLARFVTELEEAEASVHAAHLGVITNASKGALTETRVVETVVGGAVKSTVTTTITKPPQWTASAWMLQSRRPDLYRRRFEVTGADGTPLSQSDRADRADRIGEVLEAYLAGKDDQAKVSSPE